MTDLTPGFADPVRDSQSCFRAVLDAMARPGQVLRIPAGTEPPAPLCPAAAAVLLTLVDNETSLWLDPAAGRARDWIAFHTGAPAAGQIGRAAFALALTVPDIAALHPGTHEEPETSATLILQVASLAEGSAFRLSGPGLRSTATLRVDGLGAGFIDAWAANRIRFPLGVDVILCAGDLIAALPRTVSIEEG